VWGFDPNLYLALFHFGRQNRLSMIALNVDRALISRVGREGWATIPAGQRGGLSDPAPATDAYLRYLAGVFAEKLRFGVPGGPQEDRAHPNQPDLALVMARDDFKRFVGAQLTWDRAMAEAEARRKRPQSLVIGVVGQGHAQFGHGVPHQLSDLGIADVAVLLPVDSATACQGLPTGVAEAVFVVEPSEHLEQAPPKPRLGVGIQRTDDGVQVTRVLAGSVAEAGDIAAGDIVVSATGMPVEKVSQLIAIIGRQAPGTWLPMTIRRNGEDLEVVAKFPTKFERPK
jgi:hypothetical protein